MNTNTSLRLSVAAALVAVGAAMTVLPGCAVTRGQSTVGEYIDDASVTTAVKAKFVESKAVDAVAINVETLNGTVMLSGFAKSLNEKAEAERLAWTVKGVKAVRNELAVRP
ncbi:BON domain-containing protein [Ideonella oryzae]|uniref:BON domain-containing protein n=1 Tax=Ideonella oryzae TaxID=2937441 RepID=A0ABT1BH22_9BURK|nr:BON domain-containing protein [Ideonella oryzae]MCO5975515.1 BON domain-containing protein [Ideonella oryzae]